MIESPIPKSIREIIDVFSWSNFRPFTYKQLSRTLDIDPNTLVQRINRNSNYFEIKGDRPKIIKLRKDLDDIYYYRDKYTCQICNKKNEPNNLITRLKDPYMKDKENWENVITCCQKCKDINLIKKLSFKKKNKAISLGNFIWEYKEIEIREIKREVNPYLKLYLPELKQSEKEYIHYHEFNEHNGQGWFHIINDKNEICEYFSDILNFFGNEGWELIKIKPYIGEYEEFYGFGRSHCLFKRKKILEEN